MVVLYPNTVAESLLLFLTEECVQGVYCRLCVVAFRRVGVCKEFILYSLLHKLTGECLQGGYGTYLVV